MRNLKELLSILLIGINNYMIIEKKFDGLCGVIVGLKHDNIITKEEEYLLDEYIEENMPQDYSNSINCKDTGVYGWKPDDSKVRIEWLNKQIKELS